MTNADDHSTPKRRHYIAEWAELRGKKQADIVRELGIEKSVVYRWFADGVIPTERYLRPLADYLQVDEVVSLFRHPDDDWIARMFRDKTEQQRDAAIEMLKLFFNQIGQDVGPAHRNDAKS
jgi:transcriptional regulator with XRE-family HTH domain